jgi:GT2 family glycosyltransferase
MQVTAVVLSWNGREDTLACLRSLEGENVDVIVVDNASDDGSAEAVAGRAELIRNERNLGYAGGMNVGIRRALERGADAVLLLNNDVELEPGAIDRLAAAAAAGTIRRGSGTPEPALTPVAGTTAGSSPRRRSLSPRPTASAALPS